MNDALCRADRAGIQVGIYKVYIDDFRSVYSLSFHHSTFCVLALYKWTKEMIFW